MATIHHLSGPATKSELDIFIVPSTQMAITACHNQTILPLTNVSNDGKRIECLIPPMSDYIDLANLYLSTECRVKKVTNAGVVNLAGPIAAVAASGSIAAVPAVPYDKVLPNQYFLNTMFSNIELYFGNHRITTQNNMYYIKAYEDVLFFARREAKDTYLKGAMWDTDDNRIEMVRESKLVQLYGRLHLDMCQQPKLLIPNIPIRIVFYLNSDAVNFKAMNNNITPKLMLSEMKLHIRKYSVDDSVKIGIESGLQTADAKYFITRGEPYHLTIPTGVTKHTIDGAIKAILPRLFIVSLMPNVDYSGSFSTDSLKFNHCNIKSVAAYRGGQLINGTPFEPDYANDLYIREYVDLYRALGQDTSEPKMNISYADYKNNSCFYAFNLTPDCSSSGADEGMVNLLQSDSIQLEFGFTASTTVTHSVIIYCLYDNLVSISSIREPRLDY